MIQRRLYIYIVAAASLAMVLIGLVNLGTTALNQLFGAVPPYSNVRDSYAGFGATTLVGLPVWGIHWWLAQRFARRNADERASALRRLYLYLVLAATGVAAAILARSLLEHAAGFLLGTSTDGPSIGRALWGTLVLFAAWLYHFRTAAVDRAIAGESGDSATLRRWYGYGLLLLGLAFLLFGARNLLQQGWVLLVDSGETIVPGNLVPSAMATMLTGLVVFGFHLRWTSRAPLAADDRSSTLRAVQGFLALAASVALALFGASQLSYYVLARLLGVDHPGGVANNILVAVAGPVATVVVFSLAWVWIRRQLTTDAGEVEATRRAGVRHLYTHLVAFLALATLARPPGWRVARQGQPVHHADAGRGAHVAQPLARLAGGRRALHTQPSSLPLRQPAGQRARGADRRRAVRLPPARTGARHRRHRRLTAGGYGKDRLRHPGRHRYRPIPLARPAERCGRASRSGPTSRGYRPRCSPHHHRRQRGRGAPSAWRAAGRRQLLDRRPEVISPDKSSDR